MARRPHFRFEDLDIWQLARDLAVTMHRLAEMLEAKRYYRYAEQLRAAALSVANNIAEGSGSLHTAEFVQFLNIARRSLFENASMLLVFDSMKVWPTGTIDPLLTDCDRLSRMISSFIQSQNSKRINV
ncbi:MAG: four helix bundle protein [Verrucomicrobia bacterium]|nr:four helix bundle protein [Verrucomicrobiota bacterium]